MVAPALGLGGRPFRHSSSRWLPRPTRQQPHTTCLRGSGSGSGPGAGGPSTSSQPAAASALGQGRASPVSGAPEPSPVNPSSTTAPLAANASSKSELVERRRQRVTAEIIEAARRARVDASPDDIRSGIATLQALLPGFEPNLDTLKAADWARLAADAPEVARKIILLKTYYPRVDLSSALSAQPRLLLQSTQQLERSAKQVLSLLSRAKDAQRLLSMEPALLEPRSLIAVLITVTKWNHLQKDPIEVLEADPDLVRRAQDLDLPFEPVYMDEEGRWSAPLLNYAEKRTEWQKYIDQSFYKQP